MKIDIVRAALFTPSVGGFWGLPIVLEGPPGIGKTSAVESLAKRFRFHCETLSPGERGEGAFGVIPVPTAAGTLSYPPPDWATALDDGGVVFVDELNLAGPSLQPYLLGLVLARRLGGHLFNKRTRTLAAMNPIDMAGGGHELAPALQNRLGFIQWEPPTVEQHASYMAGAFANETTETEDARVEEDRVMAEWPEAWSYAVAVETAFLYAHPQWKNQPPGEGSLSSGVAWPSDRTWDMATRAPARRGRLGRICDGVYRCSGV